MRLITKLKKISLVCVALLGITGCSLFPDGTINSVEEGKGTMQVSGDESRHMQGALNDSVSVDADIIIPENSDYKQYTAAERQYTKEQTDEYAKLFISDTEITEVQETPYKRIYKYSNGASFLAGSGTISYNTQEDEKRHYNMYIEGQGTYWADKESAFPLKELENFSLNEAVRQARELCGKLGVELSEEEPEVYVMDAEHMPDIMVQSDTLHYYTTKEQSKNGEQGEEITWTEADEVYYIIFEICVDGIPLSVRNISTDSVYSAGSRAIVVIGRNGIEKVDLGSYLYDITETKELEGSICSSTEALEILASKYQYVTEVAKLQIAEIRLVYVPIGINNSDKREYTIRPYWMCISLQEDTREKNGVTETYMKASAIMIDAVSKAVYTGRLTT